MTDKHMPILLLPYFLLGQVAKRADEGRLPFSRTIEQDESHNVKKR